MSAEIHHHDHHHDHAHISQVSQQNEKKVLFAIGLTALFMLIELAGGLYSGSLALIADAGHMLTDLFALCLAWAAFRFGRRAANDTHTFGFSRLEVIASLLNALALFVIVIPIVYEAWQRFFSPVAIMTWPMFLVAAAGMLVNLLILWIMTRGETEQENIKGVILHVVSDLLGSLAAIVAVIVIALTGWTPIDPLLSVFVSLLILRGAWKLLKKSVHILLEGAPEGAVPEQIRAALLEAVPNLDKVEHIHVWQLSSGRIMATLHLRPRQEQQAKQVVRQAEQVLRERFNIEHSTLAIAWHDELGTSSCELASPTPATECASHKHTPH